MKIEWESPEITLVIIHVELEYGFIQKVFTYLPVFDEDKKFIFR
jgi:hypothetical protein